MTVTWGVLNTTGTATVTYPCVAVTTNCAAGANPLLQTVYRITT